MSETLGAWRWMLACCGAVVLIDQVSKAIIVSSLDPGQRESVALGVDLTNTANRGWRSASETGRDSFSR